MMMMPAHFFDENAKRGRPCKYEVRHLAVGESAYFPEADSRKVGNAVRNKKPMRFRCRRIWKDGLPQIKVTRIA